MDDTQFSQKTNLRTGINLVRAARRNLQVGNLEETRELIRCADEFLTRVESPTAEVLPFPQVPHLRTRQ